MTSGVHCSQFSPSLSPHGNSDVTSRSRSMSVTSSMEYTTDPGFVTSTNSCAARGDVITSQANFELAFPPCAGAKDTKGDLLLTSSPKLSSFDDADVTKSTCKMEDDVIKKEPKREIKVEPGEIK